MAGDEGRSGWMGEEPRLAETTSWTRTGEAGKERRAGTHGQEAGHVRVRDVRGGGVERWQATDDDEVDRYEEEEWSSGSMGKTRLRRWLEDGRRTTRGSWRVKGFAEAVERPWSFPREDGSKSRGARRRLHPQRDEEGSREDEGEDGGGQGGDDPGADGEMDRGRPGVRGGCGSQVEDNGSGRFGGGLEDGAQPSGKVGLDLDTEEHRRFRSDGVTLNYLGQDRSDIQYAVNVAADGGRRGEDQEGGDVLGWSKEVGDDERMKVDFFSWLPIGRVDGRESPRAD